MLNRLKQLISIAVFSLSFVILGAQTSLALSTVAKEAIVLDMGTGTVLFEKNPDNRMAPSSMTKIMTAYVAFNQVQAGVVSLGTQCKISKKAWAKGGSKMFVGEGTFITVEDLLRGVIIQSGNDAAIALAECISGKEEDFAGLMNYSAQQIGMASSNFRNASGWPDKDHYSTARDIATLSVRLIEDHPTYYRMFSEREFTYSKVRQVNRNPLLKRKIGVDGIKTGHTKVGGYGLAASGMRNGRRVVLVLNGMNSKSTRASESERLMDWSLRTFSNYSLFRPGQVVEYAPVWNGEKNHVPLIVSTGMTVTLPLNARENMRAQLSYNGPVPAPVTAGQQVGEILIVAPGIQPLRIPMLAGESVQANGKIGSVINGVQYSLFGVGD
jgi:serine-type D-Ala-D-Ala carboxypeptidase (penicillin-binding protein 5/6)